MVSQPVKADPVVQALTVVKENHRRAAVDPDDRVGVTVIVEVASRQTAPDSFSQTPRRWIC